MKRPALLLALACTVAVTGCTRLDHLGREPSFTAVPRDPEMPPLNPSFEIQRPVAIDNRSYPGMGASRAGISPRTRPVRASYSALHGPEFSGYPTHGVGASAGSLWSSDPKSLFGDRRAKKAGDILTVLIDIDDQAQLSNTTSRERAGDENVKASTLFGLEEVANRLLPGKGLGEGASVGSTSTASGQGRVQRNEAISLKIAARVIEVLPTGHLMITGRQQVRVNFELRDLQIVGLIRPEDVTRSNTITYDKMAEARISYGGRGHISDVQQARYGQQLLDMIAPF